MPCGFDEHLLAALALGGDGRRSAAPTTSPRPIYHRLIDGVRSAAISTAARAEQLRSVRLIQTLASVRLHGRRQGHDGDARRGRRPARVCRCCPCRATMSGGSGRSSKASGSSSGSGEAGSVGSSRLSCFVKSPASHTCSQGIQRRVLAWATRHSFGGVAVKNFERTLYEGLLVAFGKMLASHNAFAQGR